MIMVYSVKNNFISHKLSAADIILLTSIIELKNNTLILFLYSFWVIYSQIHLHTIL